MSTDKSTIAINTERAWRLTLDADRRKTSLARIASVDGVGEMGQFYITAQMPGGSSHKMVVTGAFLDKKGAKLAQTSKALFRVGAPLLWRQTAGVQLKSTTSKTMRDQPASYWDVTAVFTPAQEAEWIAEGLL